MIVFIIIFLKHVVSLLFGCVLFSSSYINFCHINQAIKVILNLESRFICFLLFYLNRFRRQANVTPKSYLSFLAGYKSLYLVKVRSELKYVMNFKPCTGNFTNVKTDHVGAN